MSETLMQINPDGWGDPQQIYPWSMVEFDEFLFVGTGHRDAFVPGRELGASTVQRYDGTEWVEVGADGFGDPNNDGVRSLTTFDGQIYAATFNKNEGAEIWRSTDGENWEIVVDNGFGDPSAFTIRGMTEYDGFIYAGVQKRIGGRGEIWRSEDGENWDIVYEATFFSGDTSFHAFEEFDGYLYTVTRNPGLIAPGGGGAQVYRTLDGETWEQVVGGRGNSEEAGFGNSNNGTILHIQAFNGELYMSTLNLTDGFGLYKTSDGLNYEQVGEFGFGDPTAVYGWRMEVYEGALYLGVANRGEGEGAELYRTFNGETFEELVGDEGTLAGHGYDSPDVHWGTRTLAVYDDKLYAGVSNYPYDEPGANPIGARIFELDVNADHLSL